MLKVPLITLQPDCTQQQMENIQLSQNMILMVKSFINLTAYIIFEYAAQTREKIMFGNQFAI